MARRITEAKLMQMQFDSLSRLVRNLLIDNKNFETGYYFSEHPSSASYVNGPLREQAEAILERIEDVRNQAVDMADTLDEAEAASGGSDQGGLTARPRPDVGDGVYELEGDGLVYTSPRDAALAVLERSADIRKGIVLDRSEGWWMRQRMLSHLASLLQRLVPLSKDWHCILGVHSWGNYGSEMIEYEFHHYQGCQLLECALGCGQRAACPTYDGLPSPSTKAGQRVAAWLRGEGQAMWVS